MKIDYNGQEIEAYSLIMTKENALDILNGKKSIETRMLSCLLYTSDAADD